MKYSNPELLEHLASSYVLGTLSRSANSRFEKLLHDRADVRVLVAQWEARLGQLASSIPSQQAPKQMWAAIAARTQPTATVASGWLGWLRPAGFGLGGLAAGVLAASAVFFTAPALFMSADQIAMRTGEKLPQSYVGLLTDAAGNGKVLASSLRHGKTMSIKVIGPFTPPAAGRLVLWAVPADAPAFAIGTVPAKGSAVGMLPDTSEKLLSKVSKLIVTVETDAAPVAPSDNVFFSGNCAKLW
jgi:anti-sigma-K factor RskA